MGQTNFKLKHLLAGLGWILALSLLVYLIHIQKNNQSFLTNFANQYPVQTQAIRAEGTELINPLLVCGEPPAALELSSFKAETQKYIDTQKAAGNIESASVYYRELNPAKWMGINEDEKYTPASLLKVASMIAFYKLSEKDPGILSKQITYSSKVDANQALHFKPSSPTLEPGQTYSVDEVINDMIRASDNNAALLLNQNIDPKQLSKIYSDLGLPAPLSVDFLTTQEYSRFFRILYNATYLTPELSEKALALLTQVDFGKGIAAGVPDGVKVAHKYGERGQIVRGSLTEPRELHDCGIVYRPDNPYFLCVMTKGNDFEKDKKVIEDISAKAYAESTP